MNKANHQYVSTLRDWRSLASAVAKTKSGMSTLITRLNEDLCDHVVLDEYRRVPLEDHRRYFRVHHFSLIRSSRMDHLGSYSFLSLSVPFRSTLYGIITRCSCPHENYQLPVWSNHRRTKQTIRREISDRSTSNKVFHCQESGKNSRFPNYTYSPKICCAWLAVWIRTTSCCEEFAFGHPSFHSLLPYSFRSSFCTISLRTVTTEGSQLSVYPWMLYDYRHTDIWSRHPVFVPSGNFSTTWCSFYKTFSSFMIDS